MKITFDTSALTDQADNLGQLDAATLATMRRDTVNVVSLMVRDKSITQTVADLNLTRDYVEGRIARDEAKGGAALALVRSEVRGTTLQRFGAQQATKKVNWSNSRILQLTGESGFVNGAVSGPRTRLPNGKISLQWTERAGDKSRGIEEDQKAAGISVDVNRKGEKTIRAAFTMPLNNGNGFGVFRRELGQVKHLYGPSVYQTFRRHISTNEQAISNSLQDEFMQRLDEQLEKALA